MSISWLLGNREIAERPVNYNGVATWLACIQPQAALCDHCRSIFGCSGNSQGGVRFPTGGIARERSRNSCELLDVSRSGETPGPTV
jgi:hypothetical protein